MLLAAYNGTIVRLEEANRLTDDGKPDKAALYIVRAQRIVFELFSGIDLSHGEIPDNVKKIYLFILNALSLNDRDKIDASLSMLKELRDAISSIREESAELERGGVIPPLINQTHTISPLEG